MLHFIDTIRSIRITFKQLRQVLLRVAFHKIIIDYVASHAKIISTGSLLFFFLAIPRIKLYFLFKLRVGTWLISRL